LPGGPTILLWQNVDHLTMKFSSPGENVVVVLKVQADPCAFFLFQAGLSLNRTSPPFSE
jgi:hypothetical protein